MLLIVRWKSAIRKYLKVIKSVNADLTTLFKRSITLFTLMLDA